MATATRVIRIEYFCDGQQWAVKARDDAEIVKALREIVTRKDSRYTAIYQRNTEKDGD